MERDELILGDKVKYHTFTRKTMKLKELLPMIRSSGHSNRDEGGIDIVLCLECEEWTHVQFDINSGLLDLLGELNVESLEADDSDIWLWIKTDDYNWFDLSKFK